MAADLAKNPTLALLGAYLFLAPFYVLPSGLPQPADLVMVILVVLTTFAPGLRFPIASKRPRQALLFFLVYACLVNIAWALMTGNFTLAKKTSMLLHPTFFVFNGLVFAVFLALYRRFRVALLFQTVVLVAGSVIFQAVLGSRFLSADTFRQELFFNNPNQLGYYVLLSATIVAIGAKYMRINAWYQALFYVAAVYLVMLSLSNAALFSLGLLMIVSFSRRLTVLVLTSALLFGAFQLTHVGPNLVDNVAFRLGRIGRTTDDSLAGRGYDRIPAHPNYLILGAGEGGFDRFESEFEGELHSTIGTLVFSYGIVGSFLFFFFLFSIIGTRISILLHILPVFVYGLTHQGLRFTHFWLLWAFLLCLLIEAKGRAPQAPRPRQRRQSATAHGPSR